MVLDTSSDTQAFKDIRSDYERYMRQHRGENIRAAFPQDLADTEIEKMVQSLALSASEKIAVMDNVKELFAVIHD
jgi:hypothetical protein